MCVVVELRRRLYPGAIFGTGSLLLRERRNAACVADKATDVWVCELTQENHAALTGEAGRVWRLSLHSALSFQRRTADDRLVRLKQGARPQQTDYDKIRSDLAGFQGRS